MQDIPQSREAAKEGNKNNKREKQDSGNDLLEKVHNDTDIYVRPNQPDRSVLNDLSTTRTVSSIAYSYNKDIQCITK